MLVVGQEGGKENRGVLGTSSGRLQLPIVELLVLRATGVTSKSVSVPGSLAEQRDWVSLRLVQQQQSINLELKNQALARSLEGDALKLSAKLDR
ncbi:unnamed protein product, partial [Laminaria digitata]